MVLQAFDKICDRMAVEADLIDGSEKRKPAVGIKNNDIGMMDIFKWIETPFREGVPFIALKLEKLDCYPCQGRSTTNVTTKESYQFS